MFGRARRSSVVTSEARGIDPAARHNTPLPQPPPLPQRKDHKETQKKSRKEMAESTKSTIAQATKTFKKIPVYVVEEHNDALQFIYSAIGGKKLPVEGTTLLHLDAHPDMLIDRKLKGEEARSGRKLLPLLQIENWIVPAAAAGHLGRVVWLRPPWARQFSDGTRLIRIGDDPASGLLRLDSTEPYYLCDALYSLELTNARKFEVTVAELYSNSNNDNNEIPFRELVNRLNIEQPYVLDIDLDYFSTANPFLSLYKNINLYDKLEPIFRSDIPKDKSPESLKQFTKARAAQLDELETLFQHLENHNNLNDYPGEKSVLFDKVSEIALAVLAESERLKEPPDWYAVYAAGCTRDLGGPPHHICEESEIRYEILRCLYPFLKNLPPPVLITIARSTNDGYCPPDQVELLQQLVIMTLEEAFDTDEPFLYYLNAYTEDN